MIFGAYLFANGESQFDVRGLPISRKDVCQHAPKIKTKQNMYDRRVCVVQKARNEDCRAPPSVFDERFEGRKEQILLEDAPNCVFYLFLEVFAFRIRNV
jgi:hypothetical protein